MYEDQQKWTIKEDYTDRQEEEEVEEEEEEKIKDEVKGLREIRIKPLDTFATANTHQHTHINTHTSAYSRATNMI